MVLFIVVRFVRMVIIYYSLCSLYTQGSYDDTTAFSDMRVILYVSLPVLIRIEIKGTM